jgi:molecular chaperone DnaK (HSP70)
MSGGESGQNEYIFESQADLVIGIDFGTTFSGVAWALTGEAANTTDKNKIAKSVEIIRQWPGSGSADKVPTVLAYNVLPPTWGFPALKTTEQQIAHFKLGLQKDVRKYYSMAPVAKPPSSQKSTPAVSVLGGFLNDNNWHHPALKSKTALDFAADYLTGICEYVLKQRLVRVYDPDFLARQQLSYVVTVPAIWGDEARELTRQAAFRAGILRHKLMLITEPEAAACYCATLCKEANLMVGDLFLICDAGGGTVVTSPLYSTLVT